MYHPYALQRAGNDTWLQVVEQRNWRQEPNWAYHPVAHEVPDRRRLKFWPSLMARTFWWFDEALHGRLLKINGSCKNVVLVRFADVCGGQSWLLGKLRSMGLALNPRVESFARVTQYQKMRHPSKDYTVDTVEKRDSMLLRFGLSLRPYQAHLYPPEECHVMQVYTGAFVWQPKGPGEPPFGLGLGIDPRPRGPLAL